MVSKKVLQLILEHQTACNGEFLKILEVCEKLRETLDLCRVGRKNLSVAEKQFSTSLSILANYRKRRLAQNLLNNLITIRKLHNFDQRLQELLAREDYAGAIMELQNCKKTAAKYKHFNCIAALSSKLQETLECTDGQLERILAQTCYYFNGERYEKLQVAYNLLEKSQISMIDNLHVHYITAIYNTAFNVVNSFVDETEATDNAGKNPYKILCQSVDRSVFIPCLIELCKSLFRIVASYYQLVKYHNNAHEQSDVICTKIEDTLNKEYIKQKLDHNLMKIWDDIQRKVSSLLLNADLASYKFDQFLQVLNVVHRLMQVGEEFCGSRSDDLQESIRKQSGNYFNSYHIQRLEELKIFLENESWEICPVKTTFELLQLQEFKGMRYLLKNYRNVAVTVAPNSPDCSSSNHSQDGSSIVGNYFIRYAERGTPFDSRLDETMVEEDILMTGDEDYGFSDESEEESEELRRDYVDEYADENVHK